MSEPKKSDLEHIGGLVGGIAALLFVSFGGWSMIRDYYHSKQWHDVIATLHYHGEWTVGEYRDCFSVNLKDERDKPEIVCEDADTPAKTFKMRFVGSEPYDETVKEFAMLDWTCRRLSGDVTFSCERKPTPKEIPSPVVPPIEPQVQHDLSKDDIESLRKRNECEQRFYDKKLYQVNGRSIGEACKQNSELKP